MDFNALFKNINSGIIDNIYLFYGEEDYLKQYAINLLKKQIIPPEYEVLNYQVIEGNKATFDDIKNSCDTIPFMNDYRMVLINDFDATSFSDKDTNQVEKLLEYLKELSSSTCMVFCVNGKIDKRKKLFRYIDKNGTSVEFNTLNFFQLKKWIKKYLSDRKKKFSDDALNTFITNCSNRLIEIKNELDKIIDYSGTMKVITVSQVNAIVSDYIQNNIFVLVDGIGEKDYFKAMKAMDELITNNEPVLRILSMITRQFRLLVNIKLMTEKGYSFKQISKKLRLPEFVTKKCINQCKNFRISDLEKLMKLCLQADYMIKTGQFDEKLAVELLVFEGCA